MLPNLPPPWPGARKPRAVSPRTAHDYELLSMCLACTSVPPSELSRLRGFEEDHADRLLSSTSGRAFADWFRQQSTEFIAGFRTFADIDLEERIQAEREKLQAILRRQSSGDALAELSYGVTKREDDDASSDA